MLDEDTFPSGYNNDFLVSRITFDTIIWRLLSNKAGKRKGGGRKGEEEEEEQTGCRFYYGLEKVTFLKSV